MKKTISLLLALVMCLSLCACGGEGGNETNAPTTEPQPVTHQVGEAVATDVAEIVLKDVSYAERHDLCTPKDGYSFVVVTFSMKNVGKENLGFFPTPDHMESKQPASIVWVDYNDGYTFMLEDVEGKDGRTYDKSIFSDPDGVYTSDLKPLSDAVTFTVYICVPNEVVENTDAPLLIKFYLVNSAGETVTAIYSIR